MNATFPRTEKLKSKKHIDRLFAEGKSIKKFPMRMVFLPLENSEETQHQAGFSVPKRNFKKAVDRNLLKRRMREAYRLNKHVLADTSKNSVMMFLYMGKKTESFAHIDQAMLALLEQLKTKLS